MNRVSVDSTSIASIGYDLGTSTLEVEFNTGSVYEYYQIPFYIYEGLISASSVGTYFHERVKEAMYKYNQIS